MNRSEITPELVTRLVATQFPQWAHLPVTRVALDGWDNATFRVGAHLSARLPSAAAYVAQVEKEHRWLPVLGAHLPLPIPEPVAGGIPALGYPHPWSIYRWIEGEPAGPGSVGDLGRFARDLAAFLGTLYGCDASAGPQAGPHSHARGGPVAVWDGQTRDALAQLEGQLDVAAAAAAWASAVNAPAEHPRVWVHGDVTGSNLLVRDGRLCAVIDFGCSAVGDPACDLTIAWTFLEGESRAAFLSLLGVDDATRARARGWALWKALLELVRDLSAPGSAAAGAARFGWRRSPGEVVEAVTADHREHG